MLQKSPGTKIAEIAILAKRRHSSAELPAFSPTHAHSVELQSRPTRGVDISNNISGIMMSRDLRPEITL
jgi:hypothetical protein